MDNTKPTPSKKTLADFGCCFRDGKLRTIEGDNKCIVYSQKEFGELSDAVKEAVYEMMVKEGLERRYLNEDRHRRFYFASPGYDKKHKILVLIHGGNTNKAGQWSKNLIITDSLTRGAQLDYIKRALAMDWGVVVLNHNEKCEGTGCVSNDAREHALEEWAHAIHKDVQGPIILAAHGSGGDIATQAVHRMHRKSDCRVRLVCLIDSPAKIADVYVVNWSTSMKKLHCDSEKLDYELPTYTWQMFSGDDTHDGAPSACINSMFALMESVTWSTSNSQFQSLLKKSEEIVYDDFKTMMKEKKAEQRAKEGNASLEQDEKKEKNDEEIDTDDKQNQSCSQRKRVSFAVEQNPGNAALSTPNAATPVRPILKSDSSDAHRLLSVAMGAMNPAKRIKFSSDLLTFLTESCEKYCDVVPDEFKN